VFEAVVAKESRQPLRRSCSLCSSQGARRDSICLEAARRVAPELSSTAGRARAARSEHRKGSSLLQNRAVKTVVTGSGGAGAGPVVLTLTGKTTGEDIRGRT
jgi:hypothetical protein